MTTLRFMVDPKYLASQAQVLDPVRLRITNLDHPIVAKLLGESGRSMVKDGAHFIFTRPLAEELLAAQAAEEVTQ